MYHHSTTQGPSIQFASISKMRAPVICIVFYLSLRSSGVIRRLWWLCWIHLCACGFFLFLFLLRQDFSVYLWLSWNSLCRRGWPWTHRDQPASASLSAGAKGVCYHRLAVLCVFMCGIKISCQFFYPISTLTTPRLRYCTQLSLWSSTKTELSAQWNNKQKSSKFVCVDHKSVSMASG